MFKAVVMEVKKDYIIVMKEGGEFLKLKKKADIAMGESILFLEEDIYADKSKGWFGVIGAVAAIILLLTGPILNMFSSGGSTVYAVMTFDINPSIELSLDNNGKILEVKGINPDGKNLKLDDLKGLSLKEGTLHLKEALAQENYLNNSNSILVGFSFVGEEDLNYEKDILTVIDGIFAGSDVAFLKGNGEDIVRAKEKGVSLGKYQAIDKLGKDGFEDSIENLPTEELLKLLKENNENVFLNKENIEELEEEIKDRLEEEEDSKDDDSDNGDEDDDVDIDVDEDEDIEG